MPSFFFHLAFDLDDNNKSHSPYYISDGSRHISSTTITTNQDVSTQSHVSQPTQSPFDGAIASSGPKLDNSTTLSSKTLSNDYRYGHIATQTISMSTVSSSGSLELKPGPPSSAGSITNGISTDPSGQATKGRFEPHEVPDTQEVGWGVIRLYRDAEETPGLYDAPSNAASKRSRKPGAQAQEGGNETAKAAYKDEDCTTLCILAVPSYLTPSDFLGFVGDRTREDVSHFRMVRTERGNRYMVLMKFRSGKKAREWRREWNGKAFDGMEPENLHVVFIRSITFSGGPQSNTDSFPDMRHDPFTPSLAASPPPSSKPLPSKTTSRSSKPAPPPTPSLVELPTCPVCLERMDESTGLLTILCQHVFHCSCLQKWRGSGCPVCRYTQDGLPSNKRLAAGDPTFDDDASSNECSICHSESNLWICLICGQVGCGRYDQKHAFAHYESSGHCFAMDMSTQRVWDYGRDGYVHRILQDKTDGKFVELDPPDQQINTRNYNDEYGPGSGDMVPQEKLHSITMEYTALLTSQLESQRAYFEDVVARTADKASSASTIAETLSTQLASLTSQLSTLQSSHDQLTTSTIPTLERELARSTQKTNTSSSLARSFQQKYQEEQSLNSGLMERINALATQVDGFDAKQREWDVEKAELKEQNRDLMMFLEGQKKFQELEGTEIGEEIAEGTVGVEEKQGKRKGKGRK